MVTPTTSTRTAIPQTAVSVKVKDYERYDGSGGKREVEYYDQPNYQDTTGAPRTEYTWVDTRPVNPRTQKERRNLPTFKSAVPEGYESNLAEQEAMLQEYQSQIQAQQLAPASQAQLRSGASGMAGYAQRQAEAQQFEQAKQEALGQVYSQGEQIDKAQQELAEFQRQERDVYSQAEAEIRAQELMEKQFEEIDLPQGNVVQTFTAPQGEKMIFADDGRTIAGVESAAFGQSLALPQYQAKVEEWNARVAEQEAQKAIDLSFFGKVTGQQPVSTRQGIVFKPMAIAGTTLMPPTKIEQPTRTTPWAPLPVMVYKENKPSIQATINYITRPDVVAGAYEIGRAHV